MALPTSRGARAGGGVGWLGARIPRARSGGRRRRLLRRGPGAGRLGAARIWPGSCASACGRARCGRGGSACAQGGRGLASSWFLQDRHPTKWPASPRTGAAPQIFAGLNQGYDIKIMHMCEANHTTPSFTNSILVHKWITKGPLLRISFMLMDKSC